LVDAFPALHIFTHIGIATGGENSQIDLSNLNTGVWPAGNSDGNEVNIKSDINRENFVKSLKGHTLMGLVSKIQKIYTFWGPVLVTSRISAGQTCN